MAKLSVIARAAKRFAKASKNLAKRKALSQAAKNIHIEYEERLEAQKKLANMARDTSFVRHRRRCSLCGRPRGVYRKFSLCRIHLREALMNGLVPGARKASW